MPAIGAHIPRRERYVPLGVRALPWDAFDRDEDAARRAVAAVRIRTRAEVQLALIAVAATKSATRRAVRRFDAALRREEQRRARVAAGTDRATIRARRAAGRS